MQQIRSIEDDMVILDRNVKALTDISGIGSRENRTILMPKTNKTKYMKSRLLVALVLFHGCSTKLCPRALIFNLFE